MHQYFLEENDAGSSRFNQFAKFWTKRGHIVTIIAGTVHYITGKKDKEYKGKWIVSKNQGRNVIVHRTYVSSSYNKGFLGRFWAYITFMVSSCWAGIFLAKRQDLIIATSPPLLAGISGMIISYFKKIPLVFEVRDLWPESAIDMGILRSKILIRLSFWLERLIYQRSAKINVLTPAFKQRLVEVKHISPNKISIVPNGADLDIFKPMNENNWVRKKYDFKNKFVVMYMGAHGVANGLSLFVDAAKALEKYEDIVFMLVGDGMEKPKLKERASKYNLKNLIFVDSQPKSKIVDYCVAADVCCAILKKVETFKTVYPNKIFDYMACAKPIIIAIDGVARELIERAKAGIYVEPENVTEFVNAVLKLYNDRNSCAEYGENGFKFVKRYYSREKLAQEYERILEELMANE